MEFINMCCNCFCTRKHREKASLFPLHEHPSWKQLHFPAWDVPESHSSSYAQWVRLSPAHRGSSTASCWSTQRAKELIGMLLLGVFMTIYIRQQHGFQIWQCLDFAVLRSATQFGFGVRFLFRDLHNLRQCFAQAVSHTVPRIIT